MRAAISLIVLAVVLAGCGSKGPLYLPKSTPEAQKPPLKPAPAPAQDDRKPAGDQ